MSRAEVRAAVASYISAANVPNLNQIFTAHPKRINFEQNAQPGTPARAAGLVFISGETEERIAIGGAYNGWKRIDYVVQFQIFTHNMHPKSEDAMDAFDAIVDGVKNTLRGGGHRLGESSGVVIWQAAEPGITVTYGEPLTNAGGATEIWAAVEFTVTQMIQA